MTDERDADGKLLPDAQRLTKVGRFVRSTSIDELPQLFNVLKGEMALIGFDLIEDTIKIMEDRNADRVKRAPFYHYEKPYIFLRDVDVEPIILESETIFDKVRV